MPSIARRNFIEVDYCQSAKNGQIASGDIFLSRKFKEENRTIAVLSDGLGSGVKANVLATLTATMALKYTSSFIDIKRTAEIIMDTLPICSVRKISYSTFTIVDMDTLGNTRIIEHENPPFIIIRDGKIFPVEKSNIHLKKWQERRISFAQFQARLGDRIVFFSDGVSQAGMGEFRTPLGWGMRNVEKFVEETVSRDQGISASALTKKIAAKAQEVDCIGPRDDITCGVMYFRNPRRLLVLTGPPFSRDKDPELARLVNTFDGRKVVCGGTTANILGRLLKRDIAMDLDFFDPEVPPTSRMKGVDLITEGTITLAKVASLLEDGVNPDTLARNAVRQLVSLLLDSDIVQFVVGTRINEAHQELDEAEERAFKIVTEKSSELPESQRREIARVVGLGAVKYADLLPNRQSDYVFSWDKMLALQGNTAPYLQYAYARIRSIFRKAAETSNLQPPTSNLQLDAGEEIALAKHLLNFGLTLEAVAGEYRPNFLCNHLFELAGKFTAFYENCPVLKADDAARAARLALCDLTARVLKQGLETLGIETVEQM